MAEAAVAAREEERQSLEAIYGEDFVALGEQEWRVGLGDGSAWLYIVLPDDYPQSAPIPRLEPAGAGALPGPLVSAVTDAVLGAWTSGEICIYDCCVAAEERLRELGGGTADAENAAEVTTESSVGKAECTVPIEPSVVEQVGPSLLAAGFQSYPGGLFSHLTKGITVYVTTELTVTVDGVDLEDLTDWLTLQLEEPAAFGASLAAWAAAQRAEEPGFAEGEGGPAEGGLDFLPNAEALNVDRGRELVILTWGKAFRRTMPPESQANFNAGILNGRGGGADLRVDNGLTEAVQRNVASCGLFPRWLEMVINKIESEGLRIVSINCTKGRHRSVAAAEILKREYYPKATTMHTSPAIKR